MLWDNYVCRAYALCILQDNMINMKHQMPSINILDNGATVPLKGAFMRSNENLMFTKGWNYFMKKLIYPDLKAVWMLNDDVYGVNDAVMQELYKLLFSEEKIAAITPAFNSPHPIFRQKEAPRGMQMKREVPWVDWCCPLMNVEAWNDIGRFDERFLGYGADIDWCKRARDKGWKFYVTDLYSIYHVGGVTRTLVGTSDVMANTGLTERLIKDKWGISMWDLIK